MFFFLLLYCGFERSDGHGGKFEFLLKFLVFDLGISKLFKGFIVLGLDLFEFGLFVVDALLRLLEELSLFFNFLFHDFNFLFKGFLVI